MCLSGLFTCSLTVLFFRDVKRQRGRGSWTDVLLLSFTPLKADLESVRGRVQDKAKFPSNLEVTGTHPAVCDVSTAKLHHCI